MIAGSLCDFIFFKQLLENLSLTKIRIICKGFQCFLAKKRYKLDFNINSIMDFYTPILGYFLFVIVLRAAQIIKKSAIHFPLLKKLSTAVDTKFGEN